MMRLRSLGVLSVAKITGITYFVLGILIAMILLIIGAFSLAIAPASQKIGTLGMIVFAILAPFIYGVVGFVSGALSAVVYNFVAERVGGIEFDLESVPADFQQGQPATPPPLA